MMAASFEEMNKRKKLSFDFSASSTTLRLNASVGGHTSISPMPATNKMIFSFTFFFTFFPYTLCVLFVQLIALLFFL